MSFKRTIIAATIMILTMVCLGYLGSTEDIKSNKPFSTFPRVIGEWTGKEDRFEEKVYEVLGVDDSFLGHYRTADGRYVQLYVGFYQSQKEGEMIHSPKNCMPGAGWKIIRTSIEELAPSDLNPRKMKMIRLDLKKGDQKQIMLYWFQSRGRIITSEYMEKIYLVLDSITRHRTDGSFVRLVAPVMDGNEQKTLEELKGFTGVLVPILNEYIPS
jgi:EpsI family protein